MESIFASYGTGGEKGKFGVSFMPVERLNAVMILAPSRALMDRASYWTKQLDLQTDLLANLHVYSVENYQGQESCQPVDPGLRWNTVCTNYQGEEAGRNYYCRTLYLRRGARGLGTSGGLGGGGTGQMGTPMQTTNPM